MSTIRTPNNLEVLLHCHVSPCAHPRIDAPAVQKALEELYQEGMIVREVAEGVYSTTRKGKFYIEHLLNQPYPVYSYRIPEAP